MLDRDGVIPFYGGDRPEMFAIERAAMDRRGLVLDWLARHLPAAGRVLDVGAGDGYTAAALTTFEREIVCLEPNPGMIDLSRDLTWVRGIAQAMPFFDDSFEAAYATWAFFFSNNEALDEGLHEVARVVKPGGAIILVDNAGDDAFSALAPRPIASDPIPFRARGFEDEVLESAFTFTSQQEADTLLRFYFGDDCPPARDLEIAYKIRVYHKTC